MLEEFRALPSMSMLTVGLKQACLMRSKPMNKWYTLKEAQT